MLSVLMVRLEQCVLQMQTVTQDLNARVQHVKLQWEVLVRVEVIAFLD